MDGECGGGWDLQVVDVDGRGVAQRTMLSGKL